MTPTLTNQEKEKFIREIEDLREILTNTLNFAKNWLVKFNGVELKNYSANFIDIFARIRYNIEGLLNLLDSFANDYRLKACINLILRSICSDILTALYLRTFYDKNDPENNAVKNELEIISSEYLHSAKQIGEEIHKLLDLPLDKSKIWFENFASELLNEKGQIKGRAELRTSTNVSIKEGLKDSGNFLTENEKFKRIEARGFSSFRAVFVAFKYYSQFQHFTTRSNDFIKSKPFLDIFLMALTLDHTLQTFEIILTSFENINKNEISESIMPIRSRIIKLIGTTKE